MMVSFRAYLIVFDSRKGWFSYDFIHVHLLYITDTDVAPHNTFLCPPQPLLRLSHITCLGGYPMQNLTLYAEKVNLNLPFLQTSQELDPATLHNQALMNMEANPTQVQSDSKAVFTLGARALVPGHQHKMVLCSDTGYLICCCPVQCPSTRSRPCTQAWAPSPNSGVGTSKKVCSH